MLFLISSYGKGKGKGTTRPTLWTRSLSSCSIPFNVFQFIQHTIILPLHTLTYDHCFKQINSKDRYNKRLGPDFKVYHTRDTKRRRERTFLWILNDDFDYLESCVLFAFHFETNMRRVSEFVSNLYRTIERVVTMKWKEGLLHVLDVVTCEQ